MTEREFAVEVVRTLQTAGHLALFAGGCVRDELLGLTPADHDVATSAPPEQVQRLFRRTVAVGAAFGVVEVIGPKVDGSHLKVQVATFRSDGAYVDGRRPTSVTFSSPEEDAARRDFTINGLFSDPLTGEVRDYVGGRADLAAKVLRAIGDPVARFTEDKLRLLRAVRMAARFELEIEPATFAAMKKMADQIRVVSAERIAEELRKLLAHPNRQRGVQLLTTSGLFHRILPERDGWAERVSQFPPKVHWLPVLAALLPPKADDTAKRVARRLKLSNAESDRLIWLVANREALRNANTLPPSRLFPLLAHPGHDHLIALTRADGEGTDADFAEGVLRAKSQAELDPPPLLTGDDLLAAKFAPGPGFKPALAAARAAQLDGQVKTRQQALAVVAKFLG